MNKKNFKTNNKGLTLIELLVVIVILGILSVIGMGQFRNSQKKARDGARKADLENVSHALQLYYIDKSGFPFSSDGRLVVNEDDLVWGEDMFSAVNENGDTIVYMSRLPSDPGNNFEYCYSYDSSQNKYFLYAILENGNDPDIVTCIEPDEKLYCNGSEYNYVVSSTNADLQEGCSSSP
jgi:general secretion pathway protein G